MPKSKSARAKRLMCNRYLSATAANEAVYRLTFREWLAEGAPPPHLPVVPASLYGDPPYCRFKLADPDDFYDGEWPVLMRGCRTRMRDRYSVGFYYSTVIVDRYIRRKKFTCLERGEWREVARCLMDSLCRRPQRMSNTTWGHVYDAVRKMVQINGDEYWVLVGGRQEIIDGKRYRAIKPLHAIMKRI